IPRGGDQCAESSAVHRAQYYSVEHGVRDGDRRIRLAAGDPVWLEDPVLKGGWDRTGGAPQHGVQPNYDQPFGNAGRDISRGYAFYQADLGLSKNLTVTERFNLQFRAEAFNVSNTAEVLKGNANNERLECYTRSAGRPSRALRSQAFPSRTSFSTVFTLIPR